MNATRIACALIVGCALGSVQAGTLTPLVDAPGADPFSTNPLGINDNGLVGGVYTTGGGAVAHGFVGPPSGPYATFDYLTTAFSSVLTEVRALDNAGDAVGFATDTMLARSAAEHEFLRTPGGTITTLVDPSTGNPLIGIAQGINSNGYIVGDYRTPQGVRGFILAPGGAVLTTLSAPSAVCGTHARGINDSGAVTGFYLDVNCVAHGFVYDSVSGNFTTLDNPLAFIGTTTVSSGTFLPGINNAGEIAGQYTDANGNSHGFVVDATHTQFTEISAPGAVNTQVFGINNLGQATVASDAGGFIWSPTTTGTPTDVLLPVSVSGGTFQFKFGVVPNVTYYIDPHVATGYEYRTGEGNPNFAAVTPPSRIGTGKFELWVCERSRHCVDTGFDPVGGSSFNFLTNGWPGGVSEFKLVGITRRARLNPNDATVFITGVDFVGSGHFTGTMTALCHAGDRDDRGSHFDGCGRDRE